MTIEKEAASRIEAKLEAIIRLLAASMVQDKSLTESVQILSRLGLDRNQMAAICQTTPHTVSVRLSEAKRQPGTQRRRRVTGAPKLPVGGTT